MTDTIIKVVLDKSGSMDSVRSATISGYNEFLGDQKKLPDPCLWGTTFFDTNYRHVAFAPIADVKPLDVSTYVPGGNTALLDAVAAAISEIDAMAPTGKIIMVILTDGEENSSRETSLAQVHELIENRAKAGWQFVFLGANQDAFASGASMGIPAMSTTSYAGTPAATAGVYTMTSGAVSNYRKDATAGIITGKWVDAKGHVVYSHGKPKRGYKLVTP